MPQVCRPLRGLNDLIGGLVPGEAGRAVPASLQTSTSENERGRLRRRLESETGQVGSVPDTNGCLARNDNLIVN